MLEGFVSNKLSVSNLLWANKKYEDATDGMVNVVIGEEVMM